MKRIITVFLLVLSVCIVIMSSTSVYADDSYRWYYGDCYRIRIPNYLTNVQKMGNAVVISNASGTRSITLDDGWDYETWTRSWYYGYIENHINFVEKNFGKVTGVTEKYYGWDVSWCLWGQDHAGSWHGGNGGYICFDFAYPPTENLAKDISVMFDSFEWYWINEP